MIGVSKGILIICLDIQFVLRTQSVDRMGMLKLPNAM